MCNINIHDDAAGVSEFDGIADEIIDDLADACGVALDPAWHIALNVAGERNVFLGSTRLVDGDQVRDQLFNIQINGLKIELAGLDLGKVEDVIDDIQQ